ncbi:ubiquitin domain-containing protein UBFD1 isoform X3 [Rhinoderma darwinii]
MEADGQKEQLSCEEAGDGAPQASEDGSSAQPEADGAVSNGGDSETEKELVEFKIIWNKNKYDVKLPLDSTGASLKQKIHTLTGLPPAMQKVMFKGLLPEDKTLREIKVTNGAKVMVVGSTINDVLAVTTPKETIQQEVKEEEDKKEPLCRQKQHRKVLDKGKPEDVMQSLKGVQERLPTTPISGMYNKSGGKVRLTFKLEQDQLWIGTKDGPKFQRQKLKLLRDRQADFHSMKSRYFLWQKASLSTVERTEKIPMGSIKNVISEPIEDHDDYHMMALQLGPTEASYYWVYWVPVQYVDAIKDTVLGKWQYF